MSKKKNKIVVNDCLSEKKMKKKMPTNFPLIIIINEVIKCKIFHFFWEGKRLS